MKQMIVFLGIMITVLIHAEIVERIVVRVNDEIVTMYDVREKMDDVRKIYGQQRKPVPKNLRKVAMDQLINDMLVMQKAKKEGIVVSRTEVEDRIGKMLQMQKLTLKEFKAKLAKEGQSYEKLFESMRKQLVVQKLFRKSTAGDKKGIKIEDSEIKAFYENILKENPIQLSMYTFHHIYIYLNPGASFTARLKAEKRVELARKMVKAGQAYPFISRYTGARFKEIKDVRVSRTLPKYLMPVLGKNMYVGKYKDFKVVNEIPGLPGYHAVKVVKVSRVPLEKVKGSIRRILMEKKMGTAMENWVKALRKEARIIFK